MSVDYWLMRAQVAVEIEARRMIEEVGSQSATEHTERDVLKASRLIGELRKYLKGANSTPLEIANPTATEEV